MTKKLAIAAAVASAAAVVSFAAPAQAATRYYQQAVSGASQQECNAAGTQLAQQKMAEGYLVTWVGCAHQNFHWEGSVAWSS
jgi:hypothetical protein